LKSTKGKGNHDFHSRNKFFVGEQDTKKKVVSRMGFGKKPKKKKYI